MRRSLSSRLSSLESAPLRRREDLTGLSDRELDFLERCVMRAEEVGHEAMLAELGTDDRLELETAASKVKYDWVH